MLKKLYNTLSGNRTYTAVAFSLGSTFMEVKDSAAAEQALQQEASSSAGGALAQELQDLIANASEQASTGYCSSISGMSDEQSRQDDQRCAQVDILSRNGNLDQLREAICASIPKGTYFHEPHLLDKDQWGPGAHCLSGCGMGGGCGTSKFFVFACYCDRSSSKRSFLPSL
jgi:thioredoxin-like negative regulator of GroEL